MNHSKRIIREFLATCDNPPDGYSCRPKRDTWCYDCEMEIVFHGPLGTAYEGGKFELKMKLSTSYPSEPPEIKFVTPIYHPNVDIQGNICLDILSNWKSNESIISVLNFLHKDLIYPDVVTALLPVVAYEYLYENDKFTERAKQWTKDFATATK